ncbi:hypothetical protein HNY73_011766 [Argiope bruennichi]|uniref:Uncharacterized protein n=1 Tax=Argiope bruennichi TaxID=94029 RepID=A0A8T0EUF1_ARGBR|nr:hypothetical protein HNY73_011766 [Argiope bruennichi]
MSNTASFHIAFIGKKDTLCTEKKRRRDTKAHSEKMVRYEYKSFSDPRSAQAASNLGHTYVTERFREFETFCNELEILISDPE